MYHFNFTPVFENFDLLLYGAWLTIRLSFAAMILGLIVSVLGAAARTSHSKVLHAIVGAVQARGCAPPRPCAFPFLHAHPRAPSPRSARARCSRSG